MFPPSFPSSVPYSGLPFPPRGPVGTVPPHRRYYERLRLPDFRPASLRLLRSAVPSVAPLFAPVEAEHAVRGPGRLRVARPFTAGEARISQVPGDPSVHSLRSKTPVRPRPLANAGLRCCRRVVRGRRLRRRIRFRGSITRLAHFLCTLRSRGYPRTTQHSVVGWSLAFAGQGSSCRDPLEGFGQLHDFLLRQASPDAPGARSGT